MAMRLLMTPGSRESGSLSPPDHEHEVHCSARLNDNWCPGHTEALPTIPEETMDGATITPNYRALTIKVNKPSTRIPFIYSYPNNSHPKVDITVINSTQSTNFEIIERNTDHCIHEKCTTHVSIKTEPDFCSANSGKYEFLNVKVKVENVTGEARIKYHVPCACKCSDNAEKDSKICGGKGDYACGVCKCHKGWSGKYCDVPPVCDNRRGDLQCTNSYSDVECSGNGYCGPCDACICFDDREGSQYFQKDNACADLCMIINYNYELCLHDKPEGKCQDHLNIDPYNKTRASETDEMNRKVWVQCQDLLDGCNIKYLAMRDANDELHVMKINSCNGVQDSFVTGNVNITLPTVLGVIAIVAAATAVAGYMVWKAKNAPVPLAASHYQELEGPENSAGINPLYKAPTSSYNNPLWKGAAKV
ncbi:integrin beta pat-3-like [Ostrinia furnacalis]|uniref:integrin beta pat-3-like n=1 Tax=Ostrinia furnacalis TaxID=93504 RepID=UPI0010399B78|nr:integrin beta pat-3-like [Ostrinia furnacalis]